MTTGQFETTAKNENGANGIDTLTQAQEGCWFGIAIPEVGRLAECADGYKFIGQPCDNCDTGRLALIKREVCCNTCSYSGGRFTRWCDEGFSLEQTVEFLRRELADVKLDRLAREAAVEPPGSQAYWVLAWHQSNYCRRVAWSGQRCPLCAEGQLEFFVPPDACDTDATLSCSQSECGFSLPLADLEAVLDKKAIRKWIDVPLELPPDYWQRRAKYMKRRKERTKVTPAH